MNSTHLVSLGAGTGLGAALLGILSGTFHLDPSLAGDWAVVVSALVITPLFAYIGVKSQSDPALAAALDAIQAQIAAKPEAPSAGEIANATVSRLALPQANAAAAMQQQIANRPSEQSLLDVGKGPPA